MDTTARNYSYVAWYNVTGSDQGFSFQSNGLSNWMGLIATMNSAIYSYDTKGGVLEMEIAPWPKVYTSDNILGIFGTFSIIDLVGGFFFPFVLFMLMPIIMSMVMYEKEFRLREIMKMMGLKMSVYWTGKYSKRRRSNVAVIIVSIVFIGSFLFYCLLLNHSFQTNPNSITNCFKLTLSVTTYNYICSMRRYFDF